MSNNKLPIFLIIISVFFGTLMLTFLKLAQEEVNVYVAGFFRFLFGFLIIFPYMLKSKFTVFKTTHHKKHFLRAVLNLPSMLLYFSALVMMPIEKAYSNILCCSFLGNYIGCFVSWRKNLHIQKFCISFGIYWNVNNFKAWNY
jgi:hypothetical protein